MTKHLTFAGLGLTGIAAVAAAVIGMHHPSLAAAADKETKDDSPSYACSVHVPAATKDSQLAPLAKIDQVAARAAAQAAIPGTVSSTTLDNENGCLVYSVEIKGTDGKYHDAKVDAGNAALLHREVSNQPDREKENSSENERDGDTESADGNAETEQP